MFTFWGVNYGLLPALRGFQILGMFQIWRAIETPGVVSTVSMMGDRRYYERERDGLGGCVVAQSVWRRHRVGLLCPDAFGSVSQSPLVCSGHVPLRPPALHRFSQHMRHRSEKHTRPLHKPRPTSYLTMTTDSDSPFFDPSPSLVTVTQMDAATLESFLTATSSPLYPSTGSSALSDNSGLSDSPPSDLSPEVSPVRTYTSAGRKRVRPKIDLAPGQPPTARGNPRIRVFVACRQW